MTRALTIQAGEREYFALVGPLENAAPQIEELSSGRTLPVVTDEQVWSLHGERFSRVHAVDPIILPEGGAAKSWDTLEWLLGRLAERNITRTTPVVAFGGGSVGDLTGLAAGLFKRGCPVIHVPTTLLSQVDSAIGGKTAIEFAGQKNLVGLFHQPALVVADPTFLRTLDARQLRAGYVELVKYGLIGDPPSFEWSERSAEAILSGDLAAQHRAIDLAIRSKAYYVGQDPEDRTGVRALLNLGHTFGHAIEAAAGLSRVNHGEAVSVGITLAFALSVELGHCSKADSERVRTLFASVGLPTTLSEVGVSPDALPKLMLADKKNVSGTLRLVLVRGIGGAFLSDQVDEQRLASFLASQD